MHPQPPNPSSSHSNSSSTIKWHRTFWFKAFILFVLFCLLLIPTGLLKRLIAEREARSEAVKTEIAETWSQSQTIRGPILTVPAVRADSSTVSWFILPDQLNLSVMLQPETRKRGIYQTQVYVAQVDCTGSFPAISELSFPEGITSVQWEKAAIVMGLDDLRGVQTSPDLRLAGRILEADGNLQIKTLFKNGLQWSFDLESGSANNFNLEFDLRGSESFQVVPVGRATAVEVNTSWKHPKFIGNFLPVHYSIGDDGTTARWSVQEVNRALPSNWLGASESLAGYGFGLSLFDPVDHYHKSERSVKYGFLFIALTFLVFGFTEVLINKRIHPIQYLMAGLALVVFYLLLLAFSEFVGFNHAYAVASVAVILLMIYFTVGVLRNGKAVFVLNGILMTLYGFFYVIVSLQDHSLLVGSIGTFLLLALFMGLSRKMDWYKQMGDERKPSVE